MWTLGNSQFDAAQNGDDSIPNGALDLQVQGDTKPCSSPDLKVRGPTEASGEEKLARKILADGQMAGTDHATKELANDTMTAVDGEDVIRGGQCESFDFISGTWRYRFMTAKMAVVVAFRSETEMALVTAWRKKT